MYKVDFSLNEFNFRVIFNDEKDYTIYKDVIENSIIDMKHKKNNNTTIKINYINDKNIYDEVFNDLKEKDKKIISSFMDEYYEKYNNIFVSSKNRYIISNNGNLNFNIICKEYYKRPELIYIIREIYVRLEENKKALFMHGNGINIDDKGIVLCGNSGSGKTTFMLKLCEAESKEFNYLSNDRIFLRKDNKIDYFPIPLILANGTARHIKTIYDYLINKESLYDSEYKKEIILNGKDNEKYALYKRYMKEIFPKCSTIEQTTLNVIIIPKINFDISDINVKEIRNYNELLPVCFTPNDSESLRQPWILERNYTNEELSNMSEETLKNIIKNNPCFIVEYNPNIKSTDLKEKVKTKILERI